MANGTAIPIINTNEGKTKSAGDMPFQSACLINHGACGPRKSTIIIPIIVRPLKISNELSLELGGCFSLPG